MMATSDSLGERFEIGAKPQIPGDFVLFLPGHGELAGVAAHLGGVVVVGDVGGVVAGLVDDDAVGLRGDVVLVVGGDGDRAAPLVLLEAVVLEEVDHACPRSVLDLQCQIANQTQSFLYS